MNGANETDPDFNEKIQIATILMSQAGDFRSKSVDFLFSDVNAPTYDLRVDVFEEFLNINCFFSQSTFKTITIEHNAGIQFPSSFSSADLLDIDSKNIDDVINGIAKDVMFYKTKAEKVTINISTHSFGKGRDGGWYMLAGIGGSMVDTFDVGYEYTESTGKVSIDFVADKILPNVSQDEHKPKLIFRNVNGTVNEALKQKILAKGYPSVEFYEEGNKVL